MRYPCAGSPPFGYESLDSGHDLIGVAGAAGAHSLPGVLVDDVELLETPPAGGLSLSIALWSCALANNGPGFDGRSYADWRLFRH